MKSQFSNKKIYPSESEEQKTLIKWWALQFPQFNNLLFHIPNGGLRNLKTAARLKSEGVKPGVADLFLAMPSKQHHGLFIEMKRQFGNKLTELQKRFQTAVERNQYAFVVGYGWLDARDKIMDYLKNKNPLHLQGVKQKGDREEVPIR